MGSRHTGSLRFDDFIIIELYSVKVLDDEKKASLSRVIEGIYWCMDRDIDIINMSFGTMVRSESGRHLQRLHPEQRNPQMNRLQNHIPPI